MNNLEPPPAQTLAELISQHAADLEPREWQIMQLVARGLTNQQIADQIGIAYKTVKNNCSRIWPKLGVFDVGHARALRQQVSLKNQA